MKRRRRHKLYGEALVLRRGCLSGATIGLIVLEGFDSKRNAVEGAFCIKAKAYCRRAIAEREPVSSPLAK